MGYGSYKSTDWAQLRSSRNINANSTVSDLYQSSGMKDYYDPSRIKVRESRDSVDNPLSTAIIVGLDVTGSMGYLSEEIAKNSLNKTMLEIYDKEPVTNPHIMFQAIGDSQSDCAPLQATQFEADIRIAEQLLDVWFEGNGGGNGGESYCLSWYFADTRTDIDCFNKRGKKGYLFTIGDECCHGTLSREEIKRVFGDDVERDFSAKELFQAAAKKYHIYHIVMKAGSYNSQKSGDAWEKLIPGRVIELEPEQLKYLAELFVSVMKLTEGGNKKDIVAQWTDPGAQSVVADALGRLSPGDPKPGFFKF